MANLKALKNNAAAAISAKKPMWLYPKILAGFNPSERWGHSTCYSDGHLYVFGGCCGGLHFSDVLTLDLRTMVWSALATTGHQPGTRDSHSAVLLDQKMIVFGGTNGSKKINDLHILDLQTKEWRQPCIRGTPPSPRESHSATLVGDSKLVIFGGSGEGEGNYLNDVHILDLKQMKWISPDVKGDLPAPRDSHTAVAVENRLVVYGGDCGDHYLGEVDILDLDTLTWSRLVIEGSCSPGVRAGHATVSIDCKVYIIGGVGDRAYYNDVWMLDTNTCSWTQLDVGGQQPQGRFSHSAVLADSDIAIYGGCGEDERPLDELIILHLGAEHPNGRYNVSMCKIFGKQCNNQERRRPNTYLRRGGDHVVSMLETRAESSGRDTKSSNKSAVLAGAQSWKEDLNMKRLADAEAESKPSSLQDPDNPQLKRKKMVHLKRLELEAEQEEQSHSLSQQSSPSQSDQEQTVLKKSSPCNLPNSTARSPPQPFGIFVQQNQNHQQRQQCNINHPMPHQQHQTPTPPEVQQNQKVEKFFRLHVGLPSQTMPLPAHNVSQTPPPMDPSPIEHAPNNIAQDLTSKTVQNRRPETQHLSEKLPPRMAVAGMVAVPNLAGAEVRGTVDGVFDSGYLITAQVNGQLFRGVLFSPGPGIIAREASIPPNYLPNNNSNTGMVVGHPPALVSNPQPLQNNPSCMNGTFVGSPMVPTMHIGTLLQPTSIARTVSVASAAEIREENHIGATVAPNIVIKSAGGASVDLQRPTHDIHFSARANSGAPICNNLGSVRMNSDDSQHPHEPPHLRIGGLMHKVPEIPSSNGHVPSIITGPGHWVWQPLPSSVPQTASPVDYHPAITRRENVHFVAMPPFPGVSYGTVPVGAEGPAALLRGNSVQIGPQTANGTHPDIHGGVTLSLGGPGQVGGQKH